MTQTTTRSRSKRRRSRRRHSKRAPAPTPELIVDERQPEAGQLWQVIGLLLISIFAVLITYQPTSPAPWIPAAIAAVAVIVGLATHTLPVPRPHAAANPSALIVLGIPLIQMATGMPFVRAFSDPFVYGIVLIWMFAWFVRRRWAVFTAAVIFVLLIEFYLAIRMPGGKWTETPLFTTDAGVAALLYRGGLEHRALLLFLVLCLIAVISQARVERKRWEKQRVLRAMMFFGMLIGTIGLLLAMGLPQSIPVDASVFLGFSFGLSIAARQRLVQDDVTRHPPRHPTRINGWLEEAWLAVQSVAGTLVPAPEPAETRRSPLPATEIVSHGGTLYNPYSNTEPRWVPVALHLHTNRWEGAFRAETVVDHFQRLGASAVIITDHNRITTVNSPIAAIPAYEHGWGAHDHHALVVNARARLREIHPFGASHEARGRTLNRLRAAGDFVILAHPRHKGSWSTDDVIRHDYDALELFNKSVDSFRRWDEALSAGRLVWGTAGDDCHDMRSRHQTGKRYLMVDLGAHAPARGEPADPKRLLEALAAGKFLSVRQMSRDITRQLPHHNIPLPTRFEWNGETLHIEFNVPVDRVKIYGPYRVKHETLRRTQNAELRVREGESFVRTVLEHGSFIVVFNPLARVNT